MALHIFFLLVTLAGGTPVCAQNSNVPEPQMNTPGPPPPGLELPIDTGLVFLLVAGIALGAWFLIAYRKKAGQA